MAETLTRLRSAFVTSGGVIAFDRLKLEIVLDATIVTPYLGACVSSANSSNAVDLIFSTALSSPEISALDAIVAAHSGAGLPIGTSWLTSHILEALAVGGTVAVSFVDDSVTAVAALGLAQQRQSVAGGLLRTVTVETNDGATVTVQRIGNGSAVGSGVALALVAGTPSTFTLPLVEQEYAAGDTVGIALTGLVSSSDTRVEALWEEGT
jgi:hypothetical protein